MRKKIAGRYFEWDEEKNRLNKQKHKVSFETAARVFSDPFFVECPDETHSDEELRYKVLGMVNSVLLVICTDREDATRIISARKANAEERSAYNGNRS